jgi:hypothetical protein
MFGTINKGIFAAIGAAVLAVMYAIKRLFDSREKSAQRAADAASMTDAANRVNVNAKASAEVSRATESNLNQEISNVETKTDADVAAVSAGSLRDGSDAIRIAINRANGSL